MGKDGEKGLALEMERCALQDLDLASDKDRAASFDYPQDGQILFAADVHTQEKLSLGVGQVPDDIPALAPGEHGGPPARFIQRNQLR